MLANRKILLVEYGDIWNKVCGTLRAFGLKLSCRIASGQFRQRAIANDLAPTGRRPVTVSDDLCLERTGIGQDSYRLQPSSNGALYGSGDGTMLRATLIAFVGFFAGVAASALDAQAPKGFYPLKANEIEKALVGKLITYGPPGTIDMNIHGEFHRNNLWRGIFYGRGPIRFDGRWSIVNDQLCVIARGGTYAERWHAGRYCRKVWRSRENGELMTDYLPDQPSSTMTMGLQTLQVRDLASFK